MRRVFGPRTVVEAAFLVAVPVAAAALGAGMWTIIAASAVAYLLIVVLEATLWRERAPVPGRARRRISPHTVAVVHPESPPSEEPESVSVVVRPAEPGGGAEREVTPPPTGPPVTPEPERVPVVAPAPSFTVAAPSEHVRVLRPEPEREPQPEPVAERPQLAAVAEPEPAPAPAAPEPAPEPSIVVPIGIGAGPRQWNLWDLERLTRERAGGDVAKDEERQFLLMYLREFADPSGVLPVDFDSLVRDSFGELVGSR